MRNNDTKIRQFPQTLKMLCSAAEKKWEKNRFVSTQSLCSRNHQIIDKIRLAKLLTICLMRCKIGNKILIFSLAVILVIPEAFVAALLIIAIQFPNKFE